MSAADRGPCLRPLRVCTSFPAGRSSSTNRTSCPEPRTAAQRGVADVVPLCPELGKGSRGSWNWLLGMRRPVLHSSCTASGAPQHIDPNPAADPQLVAILKVEEPGLPASTLSRSCGRALNLSRDLHSGRSCRRTPGGTLSDFRQVSAKAQREKRRRVALRAIERIIILLSCLR